MVPYSLEALGEERRVVPHPFEALGVEVRTRPANSGSVVAAVAGSRPAKIQHIPLAMLRTMALLARPISLAFTPHAQAAVVMNSIDLTATPGPRLPTNPTILADVLARWRRRVLQVISGRGGA